MLVALSSPPLLPAQQSGRSAEKARRLCCWRFFVQRVRDVMRGRTHAAAVVCVVASAAAMAERKQCGNRAAEPSRGAAVCSPWNGGSGVASVSKNTMLRLRKTNGMVRLPRWQQHSTSLDGVVAAEKVKSSQHSNLV